MKKLSSLTSRGISLADLTPSDFQRLNELADNLDTIYSVYELFFGGVKGQVLTKFSDANGDFGWKGVEFTEEVWCPGYPITFVNTTTIRINNYDVSALFYVGRPIKIYNRTVDDVRDFVTTVDTVNFDGTNTTITIAANSDPEKQFLSTVRQICTSSLSKVWAPVADSKFNGTAIRTVFAAKFGTTTFFFAGGDDGKMSYSIDDGVTWTAVVTGHTSRINDFGYDPVSQTLVAVCNDSTVMRTTDGLAWEVITDFHTRHSFVISDYLTIEFITRENSWVVGGNRQDGFAGFSLFMAFDLSTGNTRAQWPATADLKVSYRVNSSNNNTFNFVGNSSTYFLTSSADTTETVYNPPNASPLVSDIINANDVVSSTAAFYLVSASSNFIYQNNTTFVEKTNNVNPLYALAKGNAEVAPRIIVGGDNGYLGRIEQADYQNANNISPVPNGFSPTCSIKSIHWNDDRRLFIAGADNGQIALSSTGVT